MTNKKIKFEGSTQTDSELVDWVNQRFGPAEIVNVSHGDGRVPDKNLVVAQEYIGGRFVRVDWSSPTVIGGRGCNFVTADPPNSIRIDRKKVFVQSCSLHEKSVLANVGVVFSEGSPVWYERIEIDLASNEILYSDPHPQFENIAEQFRALLAIDSGAVQKLVVNLLTDAEKCLIAEFFVQSPCFDINLFRVVPGRLPDDFKSAVSWLTRPYEQISEDEYKQLLELLKQEKADFFEYRGQIVTIGGADGGYAIMPLNSEQQRKRRNHLTKPA